MESLSKKPASRWEDLVPVMNDHVAWLHDFLAFVFYPENNAPDSSIQKPTSFASWFLNASNDPHFQAEIIEKLNALHKDLMDSAEAIMSEVKKSRQKPSFERFNSFITHFEEFIGNIRRLEQDFMVENSGYDSLTGLRNPKLLIADITRELDRLARQGKNFTIAMARLDYFPEILAHYSKEEANSYIKLVSELIKLSIRSFDDAYYLGADKFIFVLKQSEVKGGISALERLRREMERQKIVFSFGSTTKNMSMSCCIAEPTETDNISDLLKNLEVDLDSNTDKMTDTVLEYYEMSPLQRYMRESGHK